MTWFDDRTFIGQLRVTGAGLDPLLTSSRVSQLLNSFEMRPSSLPSPAVLCVRGVRDPRPYTLRIDEARVFPDDAWRQALIGHLDELARRAARPALETVPTSAEAVVFLDRSELLACLASDWCQGTVTTHWWWQSLLRQASVSQIVKELWRKTPEYVPAALQQLAKTKSVTTFVSSFSDAEARFLLHMVAQSFGLYAMTSALDSFASPGTLPFLKEDAPITARGLPGKSDEETEWQPAAASSPDAPWTYFVPETMAAELRPEQQTFLGVSLMLQRAPARVRAADFARAVAAWRRRITLSDSQELVHPESRQQLDEGDRHSPRVEARDSNADDGAMASRNEMPSGPDRHSEGLPPDPHRVAVEADPKAAQSPSLVQPIADVPGELAAVESEESLALSAERVEVSSEAIDLSTLQELDRSSLDQFDWCEPQTETEFGGLFYLINLALYLGFYGDFTTPAEPGIELNIWDFVALVGRKLVGQPLEDDPVWTLLAQLAAREEDEEPGRNFKPKDEWRLPPEWLKPFSEEGSLRWSIAARRLRLFHSDGFLLLDIPQDGDAREQLRRELEPYESFKFRVSSFKLKKHPALSRELETWNSKLGTRNSELESWLARLLPYIRARLRKAFGLITSEEAANVMCRQRARVSATATHVDVFFALTELPIEIRFAGLDRDPGWVPSAGRFVTFHFE
jgi:hypothetical protein